MMTETFFIQNKDHEFEKIIKSACSAVSHLQLSNRFCNDKAVFICMNEPAGSSSCDMSTKRRKRLSF